MIRLGSSEIKIRGALAKEMSVQKPEQGMYESLHGRRLRGSSLFSVVPVEDEHKDDEDDDEYADDNEVSKGASQLVPMPRR